MNASEYYDKLYEEADSIIKKYNPCNFKQGRCNGGRGRPNGCCGGCMHLDKNTGCTINCLGCKLHLCADAASSIPKDVLLEISRLNKLAFQTQMHRCFATKSEALAERNRRIRAVRAYIRRKCRKYALRHADPSGDVDLKWSEQSLNALLINQEV